MHSKISGVDFSIIFQRMFGWVVLHDLRRKGCWQRQSKSVEDQVNWLLNQAMKAKVKNFILFLVLILSICICKMNTKCQYHNHHMHIKGMGLIVIIYLADWHLILVVIGNVVGWITFKANHQSDLHKPRCYVIGKIEHFIFFFQQDDDDSDDDVYVAKDSDGTCYYGHICPDHTQSEPVTPWKTRTGIACNICFFLIHPNIHNLYFYSCFLLSRSTPWPQFFQHRQQKKTYNLQSG